MSFNVLPKQFDTADHKKIWWWGRNLVPTEKSLTDKVVVELGKELTESCIEMRNCFNELYTDLYENYHLYKNRNVEFYREVLIRFGFHGQLENDKIMLGKKHYDELLALTNESDNTETNTFEKMATLLQRIGFVLKVNNGKMSLNNIKYPEMLKGLKTLGTFDKGGRYDHAPQFFACDFRLINKTTITNANEFMDLFMGEDRLILNALDSLAVELGLKRGEKGALNINYSYKYNKNIVFQVRENIIQKYAGNVVFGRLDPRFLQIQIFSSQGQQNLDDIFFVKLENDKELQEFYYRNYHKCIRCGGCGKVLDFYGKKIEICGNMFIELMPELQDIEMIKKMFLLRIESIDMKEPVTKPDSIKWCAE